MTRWGEGEEGGDGQMSASEAEAKLGQRTWRWRRRIDDVDMTGFLFHAGNDEPMMDGMGWDWRRGEGNRLGRRIRRWWARVHTKLSLDWTIRGFLPPAGCRAASMDWRGEHWPLAESSGTAVICVGPSSFLFLFFLVQLIGSIKGILSSTRARAVAMSVQSSPVRYGKVWMVWYGIDTLDQSCGSETDEVTTD